MKTNSITFLLCALAVNGCSSPKPESMALTLPNKQTGRAYLIHAINTSDSSKSKVNVELVTAVSIGRKAGLDVSNRFFRMHGNCEEAYTCEGIRSVDSTLREIVPLFPVSKTYGTRLDAFLVQAAGQCKGIDLAYVFVYGDGFAETTPMTALQEAALKVAESPIKAIVFVGAEAGSIEFLRAGLKSVGRVEFLNYTDAVQRVPAVLGGQK